MANETNIKIKMTPDGNDYTIEVVEKDALTGTRKDQVIAQGIVNFDNMNRDENFKRAWEQFMYQVRMQTQQMPQQQMPPQMHPQNMRYGNPMGGMYPMGGNPYGGSNPYGGGWGGFR